MSGAPTNPTGELSNPDGHCVGPESEQAGKADSCKGCPNASICASAPKGPDPDIAFMQQRMSGVRHRVLVLSGKGGGGKSTMTKELGFALGRRGLLTGLVDTDICGPSLPRLTGVRDESLHTSAEGWEPVSVDENVSLVSMHFLMGDKNEAVVWRGPRKNGMVKNFIKEVAWGELDVMLVDTPPGTSDEHLALTEYLRDVPTVDGAVIVTTPQQVAVDDVRKEIDFCRKVGLKISGVIENMSGYVCPHCSECTDIFSSGGGESMAAGYGIPFLGRLPIDPELGAAMDAGKDFASLFADSQTSRSISGIIDKIAPETAQGDGAMSE